MPSATSHTSEFRVTPASRRTLSTLDQSRIAAIRVELSNGETADLPADLVEVLLTAVRVAAGGHDVALLSRDDEVSPAKAGAMLGFSRQYVDRLIADGVLRARRLPRSTHRRVRVADVLDLAATRAERQRRITDMVDTLTSHGADY